VSIVTPLPLPDEPDSPERMYTRSEVLELLSVQERELRDQARGLVAATERAFLEVAEQRRQQRPRRHQPAHRRPPSGPSPLSVVRP
jgi:hypothetical protein